jgi:hypothetical protein
MYVPTLRIGVWHLGGATATFGAAEYDYSVTSDGLFDQGFAMTREEEGQGPIRIETSRSLVDSLLQAVRMTE